MCARCDIVAQLWKCATSSRYPASLSNTERPAKPCRSACRLARSEPGVALSTTVENGARPKHVLAFQLKTLIRLVSPSPHLFVTYRPSLFTLDRSYVTCRQPRRARSPRFYLNAVVQPLLVLSCFFFCGAVNNACGMPQRVITKRAAGSAPVSLEIASH